MSCVAQLQPQNFQLSLEVLDTAAKSFGSYVLSRVQSTDSRDQGQRGTRDKETPGTGHTEQRGAKRLRPWAFMDNLIS